MPQRYFLDTSALIPRYLRLAGGHDWVESLCVPTTGNLIALVEITGVEFCSALNQTVRGGTLSKRISDRHITEFWNDMDTGAYEIIPVSWVLVRRAADLSSLHSLKGYDAVQLTAALTYREDARALDAIEAAAGRPVRGDPIFLTEDNRLAAAAAAEGFAVDSPLNHP